jgi:hypothetical protein
MIAIAALALGLTVGPTPEFSDAYERAKRYISDPAASDFASKVFSPKAYDQLDRATSICRAKHRPVKNTGFILVVSYHDGKADHVYLDRDAPYSRCIAEKMTAAAYPDSPIKDFAQDYEISMDY